MRQFYRLLTIIFCVVCVANATAQVRTVTFTGRDRTDQYHIPLSTVTVFNLDQLWEEVLYYPDTVLFLGSVGIEDFVTHQEMQLMQNVPNPFDGTTEFALHLPEDRDVVLEIYDITGRLAVGERFNALPAGTHLFQATLASPQIYLLSAKVDNGQMTIKMVNEGHGAGNAIRHIGMTNKNGDFTVYLKNDKASSNYPFQVGDEMRYIGSAVVDGTQLESEIVTQAQVNNETVPLKFDVTAPTVTTADIVEFHSTFAVCGGVVTSNGGSPVTARGVCWSISQNPTINDSHTTDGSGTGGFTSSITGLNPNTTYYVRAYATNSVGTAYGEQKTFTTLCNAMSVNISGLNTILYGQSTTLTALGANTYQWSTGATTESITVSPTVTTTYSVTGTNIYGCSDTANITVIVYPIAPTVTTDNISYISENSAKCGGVVNSDGGASVTARGVCWSTSPNPTVSNSHTSDGTGTGNFTSNISGLTPNTTYYVRAYATNSAGTNYGEQKTFTTNCNAIDIIITGNTTINYGQSTILTASGANTYQWSTGATTESITVSPTATTPYTVIGTNSYGCTATASVIVTVNPIAPTVTTNNVTNISAVSATCGGNVTSDGGQPVTVRGVCWSTSPNPTVSNSHTSDGTGTGSFTSNITGLTPNTTYYVRAYATNSVGTNYGNEETFTTQSPIVCGTSIVADIDNNIYNTVQIGGQCWMRENLKTTRYADGSAISHSQYDEISYSYGYWNYPNLDSTNKITYGLLYNWSAVMHDSPASNTTPSGVQGVCPTGWHVPSDAEFTILMDYVGGQSEYLCAYDSSDISKALASQIGWTYHYDMCSPGNNSSSNNSTGYNAMPAGYLVGSNASLFGSLSALWSSTERNHLNKHRLSVSNNGAWRGVGGSYEYCSVRCVLDDTQSSFFPEVITNAVSNITATSAISGGVVTSIDGSTTSVCGVCWSTNHNPTLEDNHTAETSDSGSFTSSVTGLSSNLTYYVRAYATNEYGTVYGNEVSFIVPVNPNGDEHSCSGTPSLTDFDGNVYNTVQIGSQCWMREDLRTTHYADGTSITHGGGGSQSTAYYYYPNGDSSYKQNYGLLYNWAALMHGEASSDATPSGVQGICPNGWHVPSNSEWIILTDYVSSRSDYACGNDNTAIAKALASKVGWSNYNASCAVGSNQSENNSTFLDLRPSGYFIDSWARSANFGDEAHLWCCTERSGLSAFYRFLSYISSRVSICDINDSDSKEYGMSVRCVRNDAQSQYFPTVITGSVSNISATSAICSVNVTANAGISVTAKGVCWSTFKNPTIEDNHTAVGGGSGNFTCNITGLSSNLTYYARAYVTNQYGTIYGNEVMFTTPINPNGDALSCPGTPLLTDVEGNIYNTVQIGNQCWMRENLRTTKYANGEDIGQGTTGYHSFQALWCFPGADSSYKHSYGLLYTWPAVMHAGVSSNTIPSGVQGICPTGWHVPSDSEWVQLSEYVKSQNEYVCGNDNTNIAKSLASTTGWTPSSNACDVGNSPSSNNATGFNALPAHFAYWGIYYDMCGEADFWSATESSRGYAWICEIYYKSKTMSRYSGQHKSYNCSVRCLRD